MISLANGIIVIVGTKDIVQLTNQTIHSQNDTDKNLIYLWSIKSFNTVIG